MPAEEDDDLYDGDYEFVDDDDEEEDEEYEDSEEEYEYEYEDEDEAEEEEDEVEVAEKPKAKPRGKSAPAKKVAEKAAEKKPAPAKPKVAAKPKKEPKEVKEPKAAKEPAPKKAAPRKAAPKKQKEIFDDEPTPDVIEELVEETTPVDETPAEVAEGTPAADADEYGRPAPTPNYLVHIYEHKAYKRTIDRPFTPEEADAFAVEYNRCSKVYGRWAVPGKAELKPGKELAP